MNVHQLKLIILFGFIAMFGIAETHLFEPQIVSAKPAFMDKYNRNEFARAELKTKCTICHIGRGGGERNDFGEAFEDAGFRFTPKLRRKFPQFFNLPKDGDGKSNTSPKTSD